MKKLSLESLKTKNLLKIFRKKRRNTLIGEGQKDKLYKKHPRNKKLEKKRKNLRVKLNFEKLKFIKRAYFPYVLLGFIIILMVFGLLLLSPLFSVKYIIIKKDGLIDMNIAYKAVENIRGKSIFSIEKKELLARLQNYQENIADIDLQIKYPNTLEMELKSFRAIFNTYIGGKNYIVTENGTLVPQKDKNIKNIQVVNTFGKSKFLDYKKVYESKYIKKIQDILKKVPENLIGTHIGMINYFAIERELHVKINEKTLLIFSVDDDISTEEQIRNLVILYNDYKSINKKSIIYVDLRIKDKAFICNEKHVYTCNLNISKVYPKVEPIPKEKKEQSQ